MANSVKDKLVTLEALKLVNDIKLPLDLSELDSVPNEVSVASTDIIAIRVNGTTYKIPVSALAYALKSSNNFITTDEISNNLTTTTSGKVLDARQGAAIKNLIDTLDLNDVSEAHKNTSWKSAPIGISHYYYDTSNASTTYGVPSDNCFVFVMRTDGNNSAKSRGVALAFRWTRGSTATTSANDIWISTLQDETSTTGAEWFAWTQISYDTLPVTKGGTGSNTTAGALSNIGAVSKSGDTMTGALTITSNSGLNKVSPEVDVTTNPSSNQNLSGLFINDKNNRAIGQVDSEHYVNGQNALRLLVHDYDTSGNRTVAGGIYIYANRDGAITYRVVNPENFRNALGLGDSSGALPIENGGTGATTAAAARNALGLGNTTGALPIANGGTGATSNTGALSNLGGVSKSGDTMTGSLTLQSPAVFNEKSTTIDLNTDPSSSIYNSGIYNRDKNNASISQIDSAQLTSGQTVLRMLLYNHDTSGNQVSPKGLQMYMTRTGEVTYSLANKENFRDAIGIKYKTASLNFTASANGSYADYNFGESVYVLSASIVGSRTYKVVSYSRVSGFTTWSFILGDAAAHSNMGIDIVYISV